MAKNYTSKTFLAFKVQSERADGGKGISLYLLSNEREPGVYTEKPKRVKQNLAAEHKKLKLATDSET